MTIKRFHKLASKIIKPYMVNYWNVVISFDCEISYQVYVRADTYYSTPACLNPRVALESLEVIIKTLKKKNGIFDQV